MTREEAIKILDPETTAEALAEIEYYAGFSGPTAKVQAVSAACEVAVADMRAMLELESRQLVVGDVSEAMLEQASEYLKHAHVGVILADSGEDIIALPKDNGPQHNQIENEPLEYLDIWELRGEPIWVVWPDGRIKNQWWIVGSHEWNMMDFDDNFSHKDYGKVWIAYRHKPGEEDTKHSEAVTESEPCEWCHFFSDAREQQFGVYTRLVFDFCPKCGRRLEEV